MPPVVIEPHYLLLLPIGVAISVAYTSTGISGANFWVPVYLLWLGFDPVVGFWLALLTMLFGSVSGLARHRRQRTLDWRAAGRLTLVGAPAAVLGALLAPRLPTEVPLALFSAFALGLGASLLKTGEPEASGSVRELPPAWIPALGGLMTGVISVGIGALLLPASLRSGRFGHHAAAAGTTLLVVFGTSLAAVLARLRPAFVQQLDRALPEVLGVMVFVVPAVLLGGQLGPRLARRAPRASLRRFAAVLLVLVGLAMLWRLTRGG